MVALVFISRRKGGRRMSLRRTFGLITCPLLFFTLPSSFSLLIVIFLKALNVEGVVPICRCKGRRFMSFRGAFASYTSFLVFSSWGWTWWGFAVRTRRRFPVSILKACLLLVLHAHRMSCTLLLPFLLLGWGWKGWIIGAWKSTLNDVSG